MKASCNEFQIKGSRLILNLFIRKCQKQNNFYSSFLSIVKAKKSIKSIRNFPISKFTSLELELKLSGSDQRSRLVKPVGISDCCESIMFYLNSSLRVNLFSVQDAKYIVDKGQILCPKGSFPFSSCKIPIKLLQKNKSENINTIVVKGIF